MQEGKFRSELITPCARIESITQDMGINVAVREIQDCEQAQLNGFNPYGTFHVILIGEYITDLPSGMWDIKPEIARVNEI